MTRDARFTVTITGTPTGLRGALVELAGLTISDHFSLEAAVAGILGHEERLDGALGLRLYVELTLARSETLRADVMEAWALEATEVGATYVCEGALEEGFEHARALSGRHRGLTVTARREVLCGWVPCCIPAGRIVDCDGWVQEPIGGVLTDRRASRVAQFTGGVLITEHVEELCFPVTTLGIAERTEAEIPIWRPTEAETYPGWYVI